MQTQTLTFASDYFPENITLFKKQIESTIYFYVMMAINNFHHKLLGKTHLFIWIKDGYIAPSLQASRLLLASTPISLYNGKPRGTQEQRGGKPDPSRPLPENQPQ